MGELHCCLRCYVTIGERHTHECNGPTTDLSADRSAPRPWPTSEPTPTPAQAPAPTPTPTPQPVVYGGTPLTSVSGAVAGQASAPQVFVIPQSCSVPGCGRRPRLAGALLEFVTGPICCYECVYGTHSVECDDSFAAEQHTQQHQPPSSASEADPAPDGTDGGDASASSADAALDSLTSSGRWTSSAPERYCSLAAAPAPATAPAPSRVLSPAPVPPAAADGQVGVGHISIRDCRAVDATKHAMARPHFDPHGNGVRIGEAHTPAPKADSTDADTPTPAARRPLAPALRQLIRASAPMRNDGTYDMSESERRAQGAIYRSITGGTSSTLPPPATIPASAAGIARGEAARPQFESHTRGEAARPQFESHEAARPRFESHGNGAHFGETPISAPNAYDNGTYTMPEPERLAQEAFYRSIIARGEAPRPQFDSHGNGAHVGEGYIPAPDADARSRSPPSQPQPRSIRAKRRASELMVYEEAQMMEFLAVNRFRDERFFSLHPVLAHERMMLAHEQTMSAHVIAPTLPPTPVPEPPPPPTVAAPPLAVLELPSPPTAATPPPAADTTASAEPPVEVGFMSNASARPHVDPFGSGVRIGEADTPAPGGGDDSNSDGAVAGTQRKRPRDSGGGDDSNSDGAVAGTQRKRARGIRNWVAWERDSDDSSVTEEDLMARAMAEVPAGIAPPPSVPTPTPTPAPAQPSAVRRVAIEAGGQANPTPDDGDDGDDDDESPTMLSAADVQASSSETQPERSTRSAQPPVQKPPPERTRSLERPSKATKTSAAPPRAPERPPPPESPRETEGMKRFWCDVCKETHEHESKSALAPFRRKCGWKFIPISKDGDCFYSCVRLAFIRRRSLTVAEMREWSVRVFPLSTPCFVEFELVVARLASVGPSSFVEGCRQGDRGPVAVLPDHGDREPGGGMARVRARGGGVRARAERRAAPRRERCERWLGGGGGHPAGGERRGRGRAARAPRALPLLRPVAA